MRISSYPYLLSPGALHYNTAVPTPLCSLVKLSSSFHMGYFKHTNFSHQGFPGGSDAKESSCNEGDPDSIPGLGRSPGEGNVYPLQCSCLENSTEEPGRLQSIRSQRARRDWVTKFTFTYSAQGRWNRTALTVPSIRFCLSPPEIYSWFVSYHRVICLFI